MLKAVTPLFVVASFVSAATIDYTTTCRVGEQTLVTQDGNCAFEITEPSGFMAFGTPSAGAGPNGFGTNLNLIVSLYTRPTTSSFALSYLYSATMFVDGPIRPGLAVLDLHGLGGGKAFISYSRLKVGDSYENLCLGDEFDCVFQGTIPLIFGIPFEISVEYSAFASAGIASNYAAGGSFDYRATLHLFEVGENGTLGQPATMREGSELPEPSTWFLSFAGLAFMAWRHRRTTQSA